MAASGKCSDSRCCLLGRHLPGLGLGASGRCFPGRYLQVKEAFQKAREEWLLPLEERRWDVVVVAPPNLSYPKSINEHRLMALEMVRKLQTLLIWLFWGRDLNS